MRRRLLYTSAGVLAGAVAGFFAACVVILLGAAVFLLFIFGDDVWPSLAEAVLTGGAGLVWLALTVGGGIAGWQRAGAERT